MEHSVQINLHVYIYNANTIIDWLQSNLLSRLLLLLSLLLLLLLSLSFIIIAIVYLLLW